MTRSVFNMLFLIFSWCTNSPAARDVNIYDSGGWLMPQQAGYDVIFYDLNLNVSPADSSIQGSVRIDAHIVHPLHEFVFDLDTLLQISSIEETGLNVIPAPRTFLRHSGKVHVRLNGTRQPGEKISVLIHYGGKPLVAVNPPWKGGFSWDTTASGAPWIATSCEGEGGDIWWPTKDHISDKPDSMALHIRVPDPLICASNGRLRSVEKHSDHTSTYHWFVSNPISGYNVALNIAPYQVIERDYQSVAGDIIPVKFWVLPEDYEKGKTFINEIIDHLRFFEQNLGPYPFRADKYGVVQTPHLGMEHQTIIAYGAGFYNSAMTGKDWGFDGLHHHELAHEWWGNLVTCEDWSDIWIHEGFGTYMQALYIEQTLGRESYHEFIDRWRTFKNDIPVAPRKTLTATEAFNAPVYSKGAWIIHSLRYLAGDKAFRTILRRMAYPDPELEKITDGRQVRFASTDDLMRIIEEETGRDMNWFADVYLRQAKLPRLVYEIFENQMNMHWEVPGGLPFFMPVDIKLGDRIVRMELSAKPVRLTIPAGTEPVIDPENWVLRALDGE